MMALAAVGSLQAAAGEGSCQSTLPFVGHFSTALPVCSALSNYSRGEFT